MTELERLIEQAKKIPITPEMRRAQAISFTYGNLQLDGINVSKEEIARLYDEMYHRGQ